ncbi:MAG: hypothetical protein QM800_15120 [Paludibacter sp.]
MPEPFQHVPEKPRKFLRDFRNVSEESQHMPGTSQYVLVTFQHMPAILQDF